jgi:soluble lytic murein transglycosylase-like protein
MIWDAEVQAAVDYVARLNGVEVDPLLVHAVIEKETRHGALPITGTREPNGHYSYGPMQVEDTTAAAHGISDPTTLAIPSLGIRIGTLELARLMGMFPDDSAAVIAAYNGGPGIVAARTADGFPNQSYVDAVLGFWAQYGGQVTAAAPAALSLVLVVFAVWWIARGRRRSRAEVSRAAA